MCIVIQLMCFQDSGHFSIIYFHVTLIHQIDDRLELHINTINVKQVIIICDKTLITSEAVS